jgi:hypothetical protein
MKQTDILLWNHNLYSSIMEQLNELEVQEKEVYKQIIKNAGSLTDLRNKAYPDGTEIDKERFQNFISNKTLTNKKLVEIENSIISTKKYLSAIRYHNIIINRINILQEQNGQIAGLSYNVENDNFSVSVVDKVQMETVIIEKDKINDFLKSIDLVCVFDVYKENSKPYLENIEDFKISERNNKFISIQHLMRHHTNFQSLSVKGFKEILNCKDNSDFASLIVDFLYASTISNKV